MAYRATNDVKTTKKGGYISSIGYAESTDGIHFTRSEWPLIAPTEPYEIGLGCEDPRVTKIDDTYFLYYTAVKGIGKNKKIRIALATSRDFKTFTKHGIVGPDITSKAACLFPEKINGEYVLFYTADADSKNSSIMIARFHSVGDVMNPPKNFMDRNTIQQYNENVVFKPPKHAFRGAEVGAVPMKTPKGWLFIYCSINTSDHPEWTISAALLDLKNPQKIIASTPEPILKPETDAEVTGVENNVTFPEGAVIVGEKLYVYYGSGDQGCCLATCSYTKLSANLYWQPGRLTS